ncbi:MAG: NUDIX domain-containing protein [Candidatus Paracaedibacteraceae bacterium]|nr:NUDIX domain-containing protein [Candidatus Paracaedibacteraceae bacterium]
MNFNKLKLSVVIIFLTGTVFGLSSQNENEACVKILKIHVDRDSYGKFIVDGDELEQTTDYEKNFFQFIKYVQKNHSFMPIIISLSVDKVHLKLQHVMKLFNFSMYHTDNLKRKIEYIYMNGRKVPEPDTTAVGTNVMCIKLDTKEVLLIKDHQKIFLSVPGGYVDRGETAQAAAIRECKEEVNLIVNPEKIKLAGIFQKIDKGERQEILMSSFLFMYLITDKDIQKLKPEEDEVAWFRLVKLSDINMNTGTVSMVKGFLRADGSCGKEVDAVKIHPNFLPILAKILKGDDIKSEKTQPELESVTYIF